GADMSVDVAAGRAIIEDTGNAYPVRNTDTVNKTVTSNSSGNPRIDSVVLYIDLAASPDSTSSNVAKLAVVAGTPAASPTAPDDTAIGAAIGAANPYIVLADISVANGAASITDANITDQRTMIGTIESFKSTTLSYSSSIEIDLGTRYKQFDITLTGNAALTLANYRADRPFSVRLKQDGTGGRSITSWFSGYTINWAGGSAPSLSSGANNIDVIGFIPKENGVLDAFFLGLGLS
ncbi:MAG: hypothetical protein CUN55_16685, partial [Phototrophicales bacterium]